jgi:hypothetical protein
MELIQEPILSIFGFRGSIGNPKKVTKEILNHYYKNDPEGDPNTAEFQNMHLTKSIVEAFMPETNLVINGITEAIKQKADVEMMGGPWYIVNQLNEQTYPHGHLPAQLSAVYWADVDENGSGLLHFYPITLHSGHVIKPVPGDFFLFQSDLIHGVKHHRGSRPRVSLSINYAKQ